jgi:DNA-binding MarR family transcriptional regulator
MTSEPVPAATLTTRTIGETESALNGLLTMVLGDTGLDELQWVALRLLTMMPPPVKAVALAAQLGSSKKVDGAAVTAALGDLEERGLIDTDGDTVATTPEGAKLFNELNGQVGKFVEHMWDGLDGADLATAAKVLTTITQRANALLVR